MVLLYQLKAEQLGQRCPAAAPAVWVPLPQLSSCLSAQLEHPTNCHTGTRGLLLQWGLPEDGVQPELFPLLRAAEDRRTSITPRCHQLGVGLLPPPAVLKPRPLGSGSLLKVQSGFLAQAEGIRLMPLLPPTPEGPFLQLRSSPSSWSTPTAGLSSPDQLEEGLEARTRISGHSDTSRTCPKSSSPLVLGPSQKQAPTAPSSSGTDRG